MHTFDKNFNSKERRKEERKEREKNTHTHNLILTVNKHKKFHRKIIDHLMKFLIFQTAFPYSQNLI